MSDSGWRNYLLVAWKPLLGVAILCCIVFLVLTLTMNRSQPSENEIALGKALVSAATGSVPRDEQKIFFEASRDVVIVNVYGATDGGVQARIVERLGSALAGYHFDGSVTVNFFSAREFVVSTDAQGRTFSKLVKAEPLHTLELQ